MQERNTKQREEVNQMPNYSDPHKTQDHKPYIKGLKVTSGYHSHMRGGPYAKEFDRCVGVVEGDPHKFDGFTDVLFECGGKELLDGTRCTTRHAS